MSNLFKEANVQFLNKALDNVLARLDGFEKNIKGCKDIQYDDALQFYLILHQIGLDADLAYNVAFCGMFDEFDDIRRRAIVVKKRVTTAEFHYFEGGHIKDVKEFFENPKLLKPDDPSYDDYNAGYCNSVVAVEEESEVTNA